MKMSDSSLRYIIAGLVLFVAAALIYTHFSGKKEDKQVSETYHTYQQAVQFLEQGQYGQALPLLEQVKTKEPDSVPVTQYLGLSYANIGDFNKASRAYKQVIDLNPYKSEDALFMIQFADVLSLNSEKKEALIVLNQCKKLPPPETIADYQQQVDAKIEQLKASS